MVLNDVLDDLGSRLGITISTTTKPTTDEATNFIYQATRIVSEMLEPRFLEGLKTYISLTSEPIPVPSDYGKFVSLYDSTDSNEYILVDSKLISSIKTKTDLILLPEYAAVKDGSNFYLSKYTTGNSLTLEYVKGFNSANFSSYDTQLQPLVVAYATYLSKLQDEESMDMQASFNEVQALFKGFGVAWQPVGAE